ncbi:DNA cytosine methyltransferase [Hyphomicrobium facile]|uniref:Cytosine-specific methyltransferase n=1 Tax=Hyphomicrobium facile TaxID=51670 RepID=A0A1I7NH34_9HYPH|nr:DNA cytosine methyltransferase [Hyphomicrobium facile]SFV33969.1 DNA (cytosine-5)-methyltransferase 1 [Hyphomicrobium facile]
MPLTSLELCAGAGGQALGLEQAGFRHVALVEIDEHACKTLRANLPRSRVIQADLLKPFDASDFEGVDLLAGGLPCPPFSVAGKQLGAADERNLFPAALRIIAEVKPKAVMFENVRGLLDPKFGAYRRFITDSLEKLGFVTDFKLLNASDFGVPQLRPRVVFVALRREYASNFEWPKVRRRPKTVGETLADLMADNGWSGVERWLEQANQIAPTVVGGSKKHGGPDLGPTRAKAAWAALGVDGMGIANDAPNKGFKGSPKLTIRMVARLQGFPDHWQFVGRKTHAYRQVGNAFPPPVARAVAAQIKKALISGTKEKPLLDQMRVCA